MICIKLESVPLVHGVLLAHSWDENIIDLKCSDLANGVIVLLAPDRNGQLKVVLAVKLWVIYVDP